MGGLALVVLPRAEHGHFEGSRLAAIARRGRRGGGGIRGSSSRGGRSVFRLFRLCHWTRVGLHEDELCPRLRGAAPHVGWYCWSMLVDAARASICYSRLSRVYDRGGCCAGRKEGESEEVKMLLLASSTPKFSTSCQVGTFLSFCVPISHLFRGLLPSRNSVGGGTDTHDKRQDVSHISPPSPLGGGAFLLPCQTHTLSGVAAEPLG